MSNIKYFASIINLQTLVVMLLAFGSTYLCHRMEWQAEIPTGLIGLAVVFPIVFSINAAYRRREEALRYFGDLKAHAMAVYLAHRDWVPEGEGREEHAVRASKLVVDLLAAVKAHFSPNDGRNGETFQKVHQEFSRFSKSNEAMRAAKVPANEVSRSNQFVSKMAIDFEKMNNILNYRTPLSLRAYSQVFLNGFPIIFGPYFAHLAEENFAAVGYVVAAAYSLVLVSLDNIQEDLEDPFDQMGTDDVKFDVAADYQPLMGD